MQNSPQNSCQIWTQLEILSLVLLFVPSLKQLSKKMQVKNVTLLLSTLPPQPCVGATLQHWWKTTSFEYIALQKAWQHCQHPGKQAAAQVPRSLRTGISTKGQRKQDEEFQWQSHVNYVIFAHAGQTCHHQRLSPLASSLVLLLLDLLAGLHLPSQTPLVQKTPKPCKSQSSKPPSLSLGLSTYWWRPARPPHPEGL